MVIYSNFSKGWHILFASTATLAVFLLKIWHAVYWKDAYIFFLFLIPAFYFFLLSLFALYHHNQPVMTIENELTIKGLKREIAYYEIYELYMTIVQKYYKPEAVLVINFDPAIMITDIKEHDISTIWSFFTPKYYAWENNSLILRCNYLEIHPEILFDYIKAQCNGK